MKAPLEKAADFAIRGFLAMVLGVFVFFLFMLLAGCATPKAGSACRGEVAYCADATVARACKGGALVDFPCTGPKGCAVDGSKSIFCDQGRGAQAGTPCFPDFEGRGLCSEDGSSRLQCTAGVWTAVACPQGMKCQADASGVLCR